MLIYMILSPRLSTNSIRQVNFGKLFADVEITLFMEQEKIHLRGIIWEAVDWIDLAQDRVQWHALIWLIERL